MLPSRRELDSRKRIDSATELDFLIPNASKRRPKAPQDAPRASQELPESSGKRPRSPPERSKRTFGRPGGLSGCFRRPRGLILEPPRPISTIYSYIFPCLQVPSSGAKSVTTRLNLPLKSPKPWQSRPRFDANQGGGGDTPHGVLNRIRRPLAGVSNVVQLSSDSVRCMHFAQQDLPRP